MLDGEANADWALVDTYRWVLVCRWLFEHLVGSHGELVARPDVEASLFLMIHIHAPNSKVHFLLRTLLFE